MHGHSLAERGHALGKTAGGLAPESLDPVGERGARRLEQPRQLLVGELAGELDRRQARAVQDLVTVRVADPAQHARVGQRALDRVALARERRPERAEVGVEHLEPARIVLGERRRAAHQVDRRALLRAGLGHHERARREVERGHADLPRHARAGRLPVQAPGDHQMDDDEPLVLERDHHALAETPHAGDGAAEDVAEGRVHRAQDERRGQAQRLEARAADALAQRFHVDRHVGQLGHRTGIFSRVQ